jgi:hypothetical protein
MKVKANLFSILLTVLVPFLGVTAAAQTSAGSNRRPDSGIKSIKLDQTELIRTCPSGIDCGGPPSSKSLVINVQLDIVNSSKKYNFQYAVSGGNINGDGRNVKWDLTNTPPGSYRIEVREIKNGKVSPNFKAENVTLRNGICICDCLNCPLIRIYATKRKIAVGDTVSVSATVSDSWQDRPSTLNWTVSEGQIVSGQGTEAILIKTSANPLHTKLIVTLTIGGLERICAVTCPTSESETIELQP